MEVATSCAARIVSAYVGRHAMAVSELAPFIASVQSALVNAELPEAEPPKLVPAVSISRSIRPDYIICLEDGARLKSMKRYLARRFGLTPQEYRAKWGLPGTYPMVAPNYAASRSALAKSMGLGRQAGKR